jgi:hypothetical protein
LGRLALLTPSCGGHRVDREEKRVTHGDETDGRKANGKKQGSLTSRTPIRERLFSLLAAIIASGAASAQQVVVLRSSIDCAAYGKQPDGSYVANKDTVLLYSDTTVLKVPKGTPLRKEKDPRAYGEFALKCQ